MIIRQATHDDVQAMCEVINPIIEAGGTTAYQKTFTEETMQASYFGSRMISCVVAEIDERVMGWQSLAHSGPSYGGLDHVPVGWGIIATFAAIDAKQGGIGTAMFAETVKAARAAGVIAIDATIKRYNTGGQRFYSKMGFVDYYETDDAVSKKFEP